MTCFLRWGTGDLQQMHSIQVQEFGVKLRCPHEAPYGNRNSKENKDTSTHKRGENPTPLQPGKSEASANPRESAQKERPFRFTSACGEPRLNVFQLCFDLTITTDDQSCRAATDVGFGWAR
jgi:hypothetical protein